MNIYIKSIPVGLVIAVASAFLSNSAMSEEIPVSGPIPFSFHDKDGNGLVSEEEFNTVRMERMASRASEGRPMRGVASAPAFSEFDTNGDGQLTHGELAVGQKAQMEKHRGMDQGHGMGKGKRMGRNMPSFSECDLDGDGRILENEFNEARSKRISKRAQQGYQMRNLGNAPSFADIDENGDEGISTDEFTAHLSMHHQKRAQ